VVLRGGQHTARGRITEAIAQWFLAILLAIPSYVEMSFPDIAGLVAVGRRHRLSAYDAAYLLLAERLAAPLATLDDGLARACRDAGWSFSAEGLGLRSPIGRRSSDAVAVTTCCSRSYRVQFCPAWNYRTVVLSTKPPASTGWARSPS